ncbi:esterase/lipase family protein [Bermanella sp. R86510]|uniref:esterase/lipase family protein n=1 Tax=unclassified Bermanella TaxID=2627862 RepID=UPI0037C67D24
MRALLAVICVLTLTISSSSAFAWWGYTKTKHPIMLVHGVAGWDSLGNIVDHFYGIPYALTSDGAKVCIASVSSFHSSFERAAQLAGQVKQCAEHYGTGKVNIMAHSQGSPTSRILLNYGDYSKYIASITSINGVNKGSKVADFIRGVLPAGSVAETSVSSVVNAVGDFIDAISSNGQDLRQDSLEALETLTTPGTADVNAYTPWGVNTSSYCAKSGENHTIKGRNIKLFSWTGNDPTTNIFDATDALFAITHQVFGNEKSDGMVGVCSTYLGQVIGDSYHLNHADAINHVFGTHGWTEPKTLFKKHANRLKGKGL